MSGRLERSRTNRVIGGVCGGLAEYLDLDPTLVRVVMVVLGTAGVGILLYFLLLILMPNPGEATPFVRGRSQKKSRISTVARAGTSISSPHGPTA